MLNWMRGDRDAKWGVHKNTMTAISMQGVLCMFDSGTQGDEKAVDDKRCEGGTMEMLYDVVFEAVCRWEEVEER